jgi:spoIIIJ-associated protein
MTKSIEISAKTIDEAIDAALSQLMVGKDDVDIEILEEGNKGIFGFGGKEAKIRVTLKETLDSIAVGFIENILDKMNIEANIDVNEDEEAISIRLTGDQVGVLIGRRGETLDSIQYLTSLVVNRETDAYVKVIVDVENYRKKREETLISLANRLSEKVIRYKKPVILEPMNPYERRIIHASLQNNKYVETYSTGEDPNRKVVIKLKSNR